MLENSGVKKWDGPNYCDVLGFSRSIHLVPIMQRFSLRGRAAVVFWNDSDWLRRANNKIRGHFVRLKTLDSLNMAITGVFTHRKSWLFFFFSFKEPVSWNTRGTGLSLNL